MIRPGIRGAISAALLVGLGAGITSCASRDASPPATGVALTIGLQAPLDQQVVGLAYGEVLEARGFTVDYNPGVRGRRAMLNALQDGLVDLTPEYAGQLLSAADPGSPEKARTAVLGALPRALAPYGLTVLADSDAEKATVFVVTDEFAEAQHVEDLEDLAPIGQAITIGGTVDFENESYGRSGLTSTYGLEDWGFRPADDPQELIALLRAGGVQVAALSWIDPGVHADDLTILADPQGLAPAQNVVPVLPSGVASPQIQVALDAVQQALTTKDLAAFAAAGDELPAAVAHEWLVSEGLIED
jgi:osmoprotectant transport system substrate-binding protein